MSARYSQQIVNITKRIETLQANGVKIVERIKDEQKKLADILETLGVPTVKAALEQERERLLKQANEVAVAAEGLPTDG